MNDQPVERRLSAILAADVVGYSRLMGADESGTLARLKAARSEVVDASIANFGGRIVKTTGDGMLVEFSSAVAAVDCGVAVQVAMGARESELAEDARLRFRIGINLGDIIIDGDDIFGDGVNVAARIEALAEPGGLSISGAVWDQVSGRIDAGFEDGGAHQVKNIDRPIQVWRWTPDATSASAPAQSDISQEPLAEPDVPSIAVLPFDNLSGDPDQEFFADGLAEDIITALSKVRGLFVIARNSTFVYKGQAVDIRKVAADLGVRYVLEGSVRKGGERLRITAQLIEAESGSHVWAERYDRVAADVFDVQDEMTKEIVVALRGELTEGETALLVGGGTKSLEAWSYGVEANKLLDRFTAAETAKARDLAQRAVAIDPSYAFAWAMLAISYWYEGRLKVIGATDPLIEATRDAVDRALELDPNHPLALGFKALSLLPLAHWEEAVATAEDGVLKNPGSADSRAILGFVLASVGRPEDAIATFADAVRLNPHHPIWYFGLLARSLDAVGRFDEAIVQLRRALSREPDNFPAHLQIASLAARMGDHETSEASSSFVLRTVPGFNLAAARPWLVTKPGPFVDNFIEGLRLAGIPEA